MYTAEGSSQPTVDLLQLRLSTSIRATILEADMEGVCQWSEDIEPVVIAGG